MVDLPINRTFTLFFGALMVIGGILCSAPAWENVGLTGDLALVWLPLAGVALGLPSFFALCAGCRCCKCGYKLFWRAVSARSHPSGLHWFLSAAVCPICGFSERPRSQ